MATTIIADCCNNHMGDMRIAEAMIKSLANAGADTAKFQSFRADKLRKDYPNYQTEYEYYKRHELSVDDHAFLMEKCKEHGIGFLTTVFDLNTVDMLVDLGLKEVKIASPDCNSWGLIDKCLKNFDKVLISTGLHTIDEVYELASYLCYKGVPHKATLLHCVSGYPVGMANVNMNRMKNIARFPVGKFGYSDHTITTEAGKLAIALGADVLECHFTLNRDLPGKDQAFAKTAKDIQELVDWNIAVNFMMGSYNKVNPAEEGKRQLFQGRWGDNS